MIISMHAGLNRGPLDGSDNNANTNTFVTRVVELPMSEQCGA